MLRSIWVILTSQTHLSRYLANIKLHISGLNFNIQKVVKLPYPLLPKLLTNVLQGVFKKLLDSWQSRGINVSAHQLTNLRFVNYIVLFSTSSSELEEILHDLRTANLEVELSMNRQIQDMGAGLTAKIKQDKRGRRKWFAICRLIHIPTYLGQMVSFQNIQDKEVEIRVQNA